MCESNLSPFFFLFQLLGRFYIPSSWSHAIFLPPERILSTSSSLCLMSTTFPTVFFFSLDSWVVPFLPVLFLLFCYLFISSFSSPVFSLYEKLPPSLLISLNWSTLLFSLLVVFFWSYYFGLWPPTSFSRLLPVGAAAPSERLLDDKGRAFSFLPLNFPFLQSNVHLLPLFFIFPFFSDEH